MIEQVKELSLDTINNIQARVVENSEVGSGELANKLDQLFPSIYIIISTLGSLIILLISVKSSYVIQTEFLSFVDSLSPKDSNISISLLLL